MNKAEKDRAIIDRYEEAYFRRNGEPITVKRTSPGWYTLVHEGSDIGQTWKRHRLSEIEIMAGRMEELADELEGAAKREGFIVKIAPPHLKRYRHMTERYYVADGNWTTDRTCPTVFVFKGSHEADSVAHEVNEGLPFMYAEIEPF